MKTIHLFRHTDNDGDALTEEGVRAALEIGRTLTEDYSIAVSSGAQRATQTIGCLLAGMGRAVAGGVVVVASLRSTVEPRWREAYQVARAGDIDSLRTADPQLVATDSVILAEGLRTVFSLLPEEGLALAVGHSPTNEAAVFGLTGETVAPLGKGQAVAVSESTVGFTVESLE